MPKYLFEYVDAHARRRHDFVEAASVEEARRLIAELREARHFQEATLLDDDLMAQLRAARPANIQLDAKTLSRVEVVSRQGGGRWPLFLVSLHANRWYLLTCAGLAGNGMYWGWDWLVYLGAAGLLAQPVLFLLSSRQTAAYDGLLRAGAVGDWAEVHRQADRMRAAAQGSQQIAFDLDVRRATALAATQRMDEALALVRPWESENIQPHGMYWNRLASVYHMGGEHAQFVECMRRAWRESGDATWARIDLALAVARLGDDPREALELLRHDSLAAQPESTARFIDWARGVALLRLGDFQGAEISLAQAVDGFMRQAANPAVWTALALCAAALAVAGAINGKTERARALITPLLPIVKVYADPPLERLLRQRVLDQDEG